MIDLATVKGPLQFTQENLAKVIAGDKWQTRRTESSLKAINEHPDEWDYEGSRGGYHFFTHNTGEYKMEGIKPRHAVGDICYLPQPWRVGAWDENYYEMCIDYKVGDSVEFGGWIKFPEDKDDVFERLWEQSCEDAQKALDNNTHMVDLTDDGRFYWGKGDSPCRWHTSRFMFKFMARYYVRITDVRVDRLHDIKGADMEAEGVRAPYFRLLIDQWIALWNRSNKNYQWELNPWDIAYTFEVVK